jgi:hypothetical protein
MQVRNVTVWAFVTGNNLGKIALVMTNKYFWRAQSPEKVVCHWYSPWQHPNRLPKAKCPSCLRLHQQDVTRDMLLVSGPSSTSSRQHLSVTILELSTSPGSGGNGLDSEADKLSFMSNMSPGGLEPPIVMTPSGAYPERRESNNSTRSTRSYFGGGVCQQQQNRSSGSDVILADNNSDTYGPGGELLECSKAYCGTCGRG